jgi:hypothetical protein
MENIATTIFMIMSSFVSSVAVLRPRQQPPEGQASTTYTSMKTFFVPTVILECSPFMIGGSEQTTLFLS